MAPMDKYTRLVGGAVHGLSCFHTECSAQYFFFFFPALLSCLGTKTMQKHVFQIHALRAHHWWFKLKEAERCNVRVSSNSSLFLVSVVDCSSGRCVCVCVKSESDSLQSDASSVLHHLPYWNVGEEAKDGETISVRRLIPLVSRLCLQLVPFLKKKKIYFNWTQITRPV